MPLRPVWLSIVGALCLPACALPSLILPLAPTPAMTDTASAPAAHSPSPVHSLPGRTLRDVEYCVAEGTSLELDLYFPEQVDGEMPVILFVHGGGWTKGDKSGGAGIAGARLLLHGYVLASVNYRLAPDDPFPAQIEDIKCAVRYLRAHASELGIDTERIGAYGSSAGGHLVSLLGLAGPEAGFEGSGGWLDQSSAVQAVANLYGPTDLVRLCAASGEALQGRILPIFDASDCHDPAVSLASPVHYAHPAAPPFLIIQGLEDTLVPASQAQALSDALENAGVPVTLVLVENAGHGFRPVDGSPDPSGAEIIDHIVVFFDSTLR